jgi:hypothetical protein
LKILSQNRPHGGSVRVHATAPSLLLKIMRGLPEKYAIEQQPVTPQWRGVSSAVAATVKLDLWEQDIT